MQAIDSLRHALGVSFVSAAAGWCKVDVLYAGAAAGRRMVGVRDVDKIGGH